MKLGLYMARTDGPTLVKIAQAAESHGVDSLWHDESLWYRGTISLLAACAANTERIRLGVASVNPYVVHPSYFAMQYGTLAELSMGRAAAAMGSGVESWLEQLGIPHRLPRTAVKEALEIARSMLDGKKTTYSGKMFTIDDVSLAPAPSYPAPLYWGAMGDRSIETCGAVADGWVVSAMEPARYVANGMDRLQSGAASVDRRIEDFDIVQYQVFACEEDSAAARAHAKELIALLFRTEFDFCVGQESLMKALSADLEGITTEDYTTMMMRLGDGVDPQVAIPDELVAQTAIAGTPAECAEQLRRFAELGITETGLLTANFDIDVTPKVVGEQIKPLLEQALAQPNSTLARN